MVGYWEQSNVIDFGYIKIRRLLMLDFLHTVSYTVVLRSCKTRFQTNIKFIYNLLKKISMWQLQVLLKVRTGTFNQDFERN